MEREERRARQNADFKHFFDSVNALIARKRAAGETTITPQEISEATIRRQQQSGGNTHD
jgi:hypothetical protein